MRPILPYATMPLLVHALMRPMAPCAAMRAHAPQAVARAGVPVVVVLVHGGAIDVSPLVAVPNVVAVLSAWFPGQVCPGPEEST